MLLNICEWGYQSPWQWGPGIGTTWRTTGDYFSYGAPRSYWKAILKILDLNAVLASYARPGAFNDPNALLIGTKVLTVSEERAQMSLWSMLAAPLIAGGALDTASRDTIGILTNREVIAVDQDQAGIQGVRVSTDAVHQVWVRRLQDGSRAVLLLNASWAAATVTADVASLGLPPLAGRTRKLDRRDGRRPRRRHAADSAIGPSAVWAPRRQCSGSPPSPGSRATRPASSRWRR
jgi:alpha-galactosidase